MAHAHVPSPSTRTVRGSRTRVRRIAPPRDLDLDYDGELPEDHSHRRTNCVREVARRKEHTAAVKTRRLLPFWWESRPFADTSLSVSMSTRSTGKTWIEKCGAG